MNAAARILAVCARRAGRAKDLRGVSQAVRLAAAELGGSSIDRAAAEAAARLGRWLAGVGRGAT